MLLPLFVWLLGEDGVLEGRTAAPEEDTDTNDGDDAIVTKVFDSFVFDVVAVVVAESKEVISSGNKLP